MDIGRLEDVVVSKVLFNGKAYEITYSSTSNNYGNPIKTSGLRMITTWVNIRKPNDSNEIITDNNDLRLSYFQTDLSSIFTKAYYFGIDFDPEYQRGYVWELEDKISLIDSIFNNIDIGKFVFIHNEYGKDCLYEILDGKQRLRAILDFYEDRFEYQGKLFSDLSLKDQYHFKGYSINIADVRNVTQEQILRYFLKLNKSGKVMSKEQLQKVELMLTNV